MIKLSEISKCKNKYALWMVYQNEYLKYLIILMVKILIQ